MQVQILSIALMAEDKFALCLRCGSVYRKKDLKEIRTMMGREAVCIKCYERIVGKTEEDENWAR